MYVACVSLSLYYASYSCIYQSSSTLHSRSRSCGSSWTHCRLSSPLEILNTFTIYVGRKQSRFRHLNTHQSRPNLLCLVCSLRALRFSKCLKLPTINCDLGGTDKLQSCVRQYKKQKRQIKFLSPFAIESL